MLENSQKNNLFYKVAFLMYVLHLPLKKGRILRVELSPLMTMIFL